MPSRRLFLIATNLMVLAHVQSFVLLTANFEDVKKLAQKFVSESIAESIAAFVAKSNNNNIDMKALEDNKFSKAIDVQLVSDSVSDEEKETNVTKETISEENIKYKSKTLKRKKNKARLQSKFMKSLEERSNTKKEKKKKKVSRNKKLKGRHTSKSNYLNSFTEDSVNYNVSVESTAGYLDEIVSDKNLASDQDEDSNFDYDIRSNSDAKRQYRQDRSFTLTTRKEKIEFDQYDNTNYPKALATSGSVTLRRIFESQKSRYREQVN